MSLRKRLTLGTVTTIAVAICAGLVAAYFVVRSQFESQIDASLRERASALVSFGQHAPFPGLFGDPVRLPPTKFGSTAGYVQFVDSSGTTVLPAGEQTLLPSEQARAVAAGRATPSYTDATVAGTHLRIYVTRVNSDTAVEIARPLTETDHTLARIRTLFLVAAIAAIAAAAAVGAAVARAALLPVERLTEHAERIAETGNLDERTNERRSDELGRLAHAMNTMLDALSRSISAQRHLIADASHELRTPLAAARANVELLELHPELPMEERQRLLDEAMIELREMTNMTEGLMELAHVDAAIPSKEPVRLDHLTEDVVASAARRSDARFHTHLEPSLINAAPTAVSRAVTNLIDNAVKWNMNGQPIDVTVRDGTVTIRDHGPGIAPADLPHIFDRFYRATTARAQPGSGLGLAIVRQVADSHGGSITADAAPGGGALLTLRFPELTTQPAPESASRDLRPTAPHHPSA